MGELAQPLQISGRLPGASAHKAWPLSWEPWLWQRQGLICHLAISFHVMTEHMGLLDCSVEAPAAWTNLFLVSPFFFVAYRISKFSCSLMCLSLAWKSWQLLHDGKANVSLPPCSPPTCDSLVFLKESKRTLRTKNFWHFARLFLSRYKNHQNNNTFCSRGQYLLFKSDTYGVP